jgi:transcriptional regulator with XRE-family HTH domain
MGRAGKALKKVLHDYGILQSHLAHHMGIDRSNVSRWVNESRDPSAESAADIKYALAEIDESASDDFVKYYLYSTIVTVQIPAETPEPDFTDSELIELTDLIDLEVKDSNLQTLDSEQTVEV